MLYQSSRNANNQASGPEAILKGIAEDGGLYVPSEFQDLSQIIGKGMNYQEILNSILAVYFPELDLKKELEEAYRAFERECPIEIRKVRDRYVLELFHGPTSAFKDFALLVLPILIEKSKNYLKDNSRTLILTATSGDTGKAALEGFANKEGVDSGIDIAVLYPINGVSKVQEMQMTSQEGKNVQVFAIDGDFDDAQREVKEAFLDSELKQDLDKYNIKLSSANSINIGRLVPQIAYYFSAYEILLERGEIKEGEKVSFAVPTGNFGDILAGFYAKKMGLPVDILLSASNENKVLKEFFETAVYDRNRALILTSSPSMDIIVSSNLERLLYHTSNDEFTKRYMDSLREKGSYDIGNEHKAIIDAENIRGEYSKVTEAYAAIREIYEETSYLMDPHTAVAWAAADKAQIQSKLVVLSTASAYKFSPAVCDALGISYEDEEKAMARLKEHTGLAIPSRLDGIFEKEIRHKTPMQVGDLKEKLLESLKNNRFEILVPATTANIGPGFDTLGIALDLYNSFIVDYEGAGKGNLDGIEYEFDGIEEKFSNKDNLMIQSYRKASKMIDAKIYPEKIKLQAKCQIPMSRGLGSSATFIIAGVVMAFEISKKPYSRRDILELASKIEGHPDNVAAAVYGGMRASSLYEGQVVSLPLKIYNDLKFVALVPEVELSTEESRRLLPKELGFKEAVENISNLSLLIAAFQNRDYDQLKFFLKDNLHQPYRLPKIEGVDQLFKLGKEVWGVYLSGAGPTIMLIDDINRKKDYTYINNLRQYDLNVSFSGTKVIR